MALVTWWIDYRNITCFYVRLFACISRPSLQSQDLRAIHLLYTLRHWIQWWILCALKTVQVAWNYHIYSDLMYVSLQLLKENIFFLLSLGGGSFRDRFWLTIIGATKIASENLIWCDTFYRLSLSLNINFFLCFWQIDDKGEINQYSQTYLTLIRTSREWLTSHQYIYKLDCAVYLYITSTQNSINTSQRH